MRWILSNLSLLNIVLAAVLIIFGSYAFLPMFGKSAKFTLPGAKKQAAATTAAAPEKPADSKIPSPSDYFVIAEQNIFHPERKIPIEKKEAAAALLPKPDFALYGTLILDDTSIAYMEDRKAPQNSPTRGKKQIPLRLGQSLSGFVLKEVHADSVVMVRGDEKLSIQLADPSKAKTRGVETAAAGTQAATPAQQQPKPAGPLSLRSPQRPAPPPPAAPTAQGQPAQPSQQQQPQGRRGLFRGLN